MAGLMCSRNIQHGQKRRRPSGVVLPLSVISGELMLIGYLLLRMFESTTTL